jgi:hypothetical protein
VWVVVDGVLDLSNEADSTCHTQVRWQIPIFGGREHTNDKKAVFPDPLGPSNTKVDKVGLAALR